MNTHGLTHHAQTRLQQRGIPAIVLDLLVRFGSEVRSHRAVRLIFDKAALKRLKRHLGGARGLRVIEPWLNVYAVVSDDGSVITVAHQCQRFRRY
jgi:hypothetical protein